MWNLDLYELYVCVHVCDMEAEEALGGGRGPVVCAM